MLLTFLYHHVGNSKYSNSKEMLETHFAYLKKNYKIVVPNEKLSPFRINICLSFDDAYFDFYHFVFPLLKKLNIKAVLAVPVKYIVDSQDIDPAKRLSVPHNQATNEEIYKAKAPFCTWNELDEMAKSGLVHIASHSYSHKNLLAQEVDLNLEIIESKKKLEQNLNIEISTFVYPLGKFNRNIHKMTMKHYKYAMRIGSSFNFSWQNINKINYRIISDNLKYVDQNLRFFKFFSYIWFYLSNTLRGR
jgi:peptidoglycan/xylan/chitin deacetylase (PgdA/CDA1 family)